MRPSRICQFYACSLLWRATQSERTVRPSSPAPSLFVQCPPPIDGITALFWCLRPTGVNFKAIRENTRTHGRAKLRALRLNSITNRILSGHYRLSSCNMVLWSHQKFGTPILSWAFVWNPASSQSPDLHRARCMRPACRHTPDMKSWTGSLATRCKRLWNYVWLSGAAWACGEERGLTRALHLHVGLRLPDLLKTRAWTLRRCHGDGAVVLSRRWVKQAGSNEALCGCQWLCCQRGFLKLYQTGQHTTEVSSVEKKASN